jgi:CHAT domain-containing protein/tetratricopeptide (TPR) repeat protein
VSAASALLLASLPLGLARAEDLPPTTARVWDRIRARAEPSAADSARASDLPYRAIFTAFDERLARAWRARVAGEAASADSAFADCRTAAQVAQRLYGTAWLTNRAIRAAGLDESAARLALAADSLAREGRARLARRDPSAARAALEAARDLYARVGDDACGLRVGADLLDPSITTLAPEERIAKAEDLAAASDSTGDRLLLAYAKRIAAWELGGLSRTDEALAAAGQSIRLGSELNDLRAVQSAMQTAVRAIQGTAEPDTALRYLNALAERARSDEDSLVLATATFMIGTHYYVNEGDLTTSIVHTREALALFERLGDPLGVARTSYSVGLALWYHQEFEEALRHCERAEESAREVDDWWVEANATNIVGNIHGDNGDWRSAIPRYQRALHLAREHGDLDLQCYATSNIGLSLLAADSLASARLYLDAALALADSNPRAALNWDQKGNPLLHLSWLSFMQKDTTQAIALARQSFQRALDPKMDEADRALGVSSAGAQLGTLLLESGDLSEAESVFVQTSEAGGPAGRKSDVWTAETGLGEIAWRRGNAGAALAALDKAIETIEAQREALGSLDLRERWFASAVGAYETMVRYRIESGQFDAALDYYERMKARELLDLLEGGRVVPSDELSPQERAEEERLVGKIELLNTKIGEGSPDLAESLLVARSDYSAFEERVFRRYPGLRERRGRGVPITARDARRLMAPDEAGLLYTLGPRNATVLVVTSESVAGRVLPTPASEIRRAVRAMLESLRRPDVAFDRDGAGRLYAMLVGPVQERLAGKRRLCIVPEEELYSIPFNALIDPASGQFLVEGRITYVAPSLSALGAMRWKGSRGRRDLLALGDPDFGERDTLVTAMRGGFGRLPATAKEVSEIGAVYAPRGRVLTGANASESGFKKAAGEFGVLHLASHGLIDDVQPLYSSILLSPGGKDEDGFLEAREVMKLKLDADIVVLSACETARGMVTRGEGINGLTRAFFTAGVPTVVASLWPVADESTALLMTRFHRSLRDGERPAEALANAERGFLGTTGGASGGAGAARGIGAFSRAGDSKPGATGAVVTHPFYWAAFILYGDSE